MTKRFCFTRWSRNAAAAFHSIGLVVNICRLKANVQERIAPKSCALMTLFLTVQKQIWDIERGQEGDLVDEGLPLLPLMAQSHLSLSHDAVIESASF